VLAAIAKEELAVRKDPKLKLTAVFPVELNFIYLSQSFSH
jgi:hypothetical protein